MPSKKKKYNARFPASRIKKIMQTDEEVGKVAQAVPVIISRTLELFVESLLKKSMQITQARNAKTLTPSHMKQCILSENRFDFLKDLVKDISDANVQDDNDNGSDMEPPPRNYEVRPPAHTSEPLQPDIAANFYTEQGPSTARTPVIQYGPNVAQLDQEKYNHPLDLVKTESKHKASSSTETKKPLPVPEPATSHVDNIPSLIPIAPIAQNYYTQSTDDDLYINEDYDN